MKALLTALRCEKGDVAGNLARHIELLSEGAAAGARIVAFPEMSLTGSVDALHWPGHAIPVDDDAVAALADATAHTGVAALFGIAEAVGGEVRIAQLLADRGRVVGHYQKRTLGEDEDGYGAGSTVAEGFVIDGAPVGVAICAEAGSDGPFDDAAAARARVVFLCSAPGLYGRRVDETGWRAGYDWWSGSVLTDAARHARAHGLWIALSTQAGATADEDFPGLAALVNPAGEVVARTPDWREAMLLVDV